MSFVDKALLKLNLFVYHEEMSGEKAKTKTVKR